MVGMNLQQACKIWSKNSQLFRKNVRKPQGGAIFTHPVHLQNTVYSITVFKSESTGHCTETYDVFIYTVYFQVHAESATPPTPTPPKKLLEFVQISRPTLAEVGWARAHPCPPVACGYATGNICRLSGEIMIMMIKLNSDDIDHNTCDNTSGEG